MRLTIDSPAKKAALIGGPLLLIVAYASLVTAQFLSGHFARHLNQSSLQRAVLLAPANAEYRDLLGNYLFLVRRSPKAALEYYRSASTLDPNSAHYWFDLSSGYAAVGDANKQLEALNSAVAADPRTPGLAWDAANVFLASGDSARASQELRVVLQNDPSLTSSALRLARRITDTSTILREIMPANPQPYYGLLEMLIADRQSADAAQVWSQLAGLHETLERAPVFEYVRFLIAEHETDQATRVWQQSGNLAGLSAYQPSPQNLIVNGDFGLDILNGGFDWLYTSSTSLSLSLDPTEHHSSHRSLRIQFDGPGFEDAGIKQLVAVVPGKDYEFSAYYKAKNMQGAGGVHLSVLDAYTGEPFFVSEELADADFWKNSAGRFRTKDSTRLVTVEIQRLPPDHPMRGTLWIDGVQLSEVHP
jgi:tetratricopeptide (TPR) repeat protein